MTRAITVVALLLSVCLAGVARPALAAPILDQSFAPASTNFWAVFGELSRAQTFTVGLAGRLSSVEVLLDTAEGLGSYDREFQIIPTNAGVPIYGTAPLASFVISLPANTGDSVLGFYGADLTAFNLMVNPGDILAIVDVGGVAPDAGHWWVGRFYDLPTYDAGAFYTTRFVGGIPNTTYGLLDGAQTRYDAGFRTWIDHPSQDPPAVPEPATFVLFGVGLAGIRMVRKR